MIAVFDYFQAEFNALSVYQKIVCVKSVCIVDRLILIQCQRIAQLNGGERHGHHQMMTILLDIE